MRPSAASDLVPSAALHLARYMICVGGVQNSARRLVVAPCRIGLGQALARLCSRIVLISRAGMCRNSKNSWCSSGAERSN